MTLLPRSATMLIYCILLLLPWLALAAPKPLAPSLEDRQAPASPYWLSQIPRQGTVAYGSNSAGYKVFRNVKDYGAVGMIGPRSIN